MITIITTSVITSLIISYAWGKWYMHNLTKWMDNFFEEEERFIKKHLKE